MLARGTYSDSHIDGCGLMVMGLMLPVGAVERIGSSFVQNRKWVSGIFRMSRDSR
jgi:hypothetical protein